MASKAKKGTPAPTSKKPVVRKDGQPTRAEKSAANKAAQAANVTSAQKLHTEVIETVKNSGKTLVGSLLGGVGSVIAVQDKGGRPWLYERVEWTSKLGEALFALIATGHSLREIAEMDGMPPLVQLTSWLADSTHPFAELRARAKETLVPIYEELVETIASRPNPVTLKTRRQVVTKDGDIVWTTEYKQTDGVERSKLALQGIQWTLSHLKPKKHGRNAEPASNGPNEQLKGLFDALKAGPVD